jgi:hypothetical protein
MLRALKSCNYIPLTECSGICFLCFINYLLTLNLRKDKRYRLVREEQEIDEEENY